MNTKGTIQPCEDGAYRTSFQFDDVSTVYYTNSWTGVPAGYPAFTDYGTGTYPWNIVEINACWSAGNVYWVPFRDPLFSNEPDYIAAFGFGPNSNRDVNGGVFVGWNAEYTASSFPKMYNGEGWTQDFWYLLGEGYSVSDAAYYDDAPGLMRNYLEVDDDESAWVTGLEGKAMKNWVIGAIAVIFVLCVIAIIFPWVPGPDLAKVRTEWREKLDYFHAAVHSASDIKLVKIDWRENRWSDVYQGRFIYDVKDVRTIWAAVDKLDLMALRVGPSRNTLQFVLKDGDCFYFQDMDWDYDSKFTRAVKDCWKRGRPI